MFLGEVEFQPLERSNILEDQFPQAWKNRGWHGACLSTEDRLHRFAELFEKGRPRLLETLQTPGTES